MNKSTILALATAASALATAAAAVAEEFGGDAAPATGSDEATPTPTARRGRGPAKDKEPPAGKTYEELQELIAPLVEDGKGDEVKKVIQKHTNGGNLKDLAALPQNQAAFEKDLKALAY
jgi:hypothetical protein